MAGVDTAPGVTPDDRRRTTSFALCRDLTLVSPVLTDGLPQPASSDRDGAAIDVAWCRHQRRYRPSKPATPRRAGCGGWDAGDRRHAFWSAASCGRNHCASWLL